MSRNYKPLRPALNSPKSSPGPSRENEGEMLPKRRQPIAVACVACRQKKAKCDQDRPCGSCVKRGLQCVSPLPSPENKDNNTRPAEVLDRLRSTSEDHANDILDMLRSGESLSHVLEMAKGTAAAHVSRLRSLPDQTTVEFELMMRHPIPYPSVASPETASLSRPNILSRTISRETSKAAASVDPDRQATGSASQPAAQAESIETYYDPRLDISKFQQWTDIPLDEAEAAHAVSRYIQVDNPTLGFFDADLFLRDLVSMGNRYCSPLLVNALLGWAFLSHTPSTRDDNEWKKFYEKGVAIWNDEKSNSLTAVIALELLALTATFSGQGGAGRALLREAIAAGKDMHLLRDGGSLYDENILSQSEDDWRAASQAAWGLFCYSTLHSLHCQQGELGHLEPPTLSVPTHGVQPRLGPTFIHLCRLWKIIHAVVTQYYFVEATRKGEDRFTPGFAQSAMNKLLGWAQALPASLARGNRSTHDVTIMHIYFHTCVMTLMRPLVLRHDHTPLVVDAMEKCSATGIYEASVDQLRDLTTVYQRHFSTVAPSVLWHTACLYTANAAIRTHDMDHRRYYFDLAIESYASFYPRFSVTIAIIKGLMSMAISEGLITNKDAYDFVKELRGKGVDRKELAERTYTCFIIDLDLALENLEEAHVDNLARNFDEMAFLADIINEEGDVEMIRNDG